MADANNFKVGSWIALNEDGLWYNPFSGNNEPAYEKKSDLIKDLSAAHCDAAAVPRCKRKEPGRYLYWIKNCDTGRYDRSFTIIRLTKDNLPEYQRFYNQLQGDEISLYEQKDEAQL